MISDISPTTTPLSSRFDQTLNSALTISGFTSISSNPSINSFRSTKSSPADSPISAVDMSRLDDFLQKDLAPSSGSRYERVEWEDGADTQSSSGPSSVSSTGSQTALRSELLDPVNNTLQDLETDFRRIFPPLDDTTVEAARSQASTLDLTSRNTQSSIFNVSDQFVWSQSQSNADETDATNISYQGGHQSDMILGHSQEDHTQQNVYSPYPVNEPQLQPKAAPTLLGSEIGSNTTDNTFMQQTKRWNEAMDTVQLFLDEIDDANPEDRIDAWQNLDYGLDQLSLPGEEITNAFAITQACTNSEIRPGHTDHRQSRGLGQEEWRQRVSSLRSDGRALSEFSVEGNREGYAASARGTLEDLNEKIKGTLAWQGQMSGLTGRR